MSLQYRLWQDRSIYQARADRQAAALVALFRALEEHRPLGGGEAEALELHRFLLGLDEDAVSEVLGDPYARHWTRLAFALTGAVLRREALPPAARPLAAERGTDDPRALLGGHLADYKRLAVAAALLARAPLTLPAPLQVALPFAIPAAAAALRGTGTALILGAADGTLHFSGANARLENCPVARIADWQVPLQPSGWLVPGLGWAPLAAETDHAFQERNRGLVESGLGLIARHQPDLFDQMREVIRWIAVNPVSPDAPLNYISYSELPGAFAFQGIDHAYSAAEACIHEFHHNRLFCLEECEPILAGAGLGTEDEAVYYSPWREQLRPLRGILHGAYVTLAQLRFWLAVAQAPDTRGPLAEFVASQLIHQPAVIEIGLGQLARHARLTAEGERLVQQMRADLAEMIAEARRLGVPWDMEAVALVPGGGFRAYRDEDGLPLSIRSAIARHVRLFDIHRQVPAAWLAANTPARQRPA